VRAEQVIDPVTYHGELFITTSLENIDGSDDALAGSLFRADAGISGQPVRGFAG
jgi:hypothetical protein